jgi:PEGA domain
VRQHPIFKALLGASLAASVMLWPTDALAQRRTPSHGGGGGGHVSGGVVAGRGPVVYGGSRVVVSPYYRSYYYRPYFYDPFFWGSYGWGWGWGAGLGYGYGWGWSPYGWGYPYGGYPYYGYGYRNYSEARVQVKPKDAKVYVDGYYAGVVDDFDGWAQRLDAPPGSHDIAIYLEGYRTMHEQVFFQPGKTVDIKGELQKLPAGTPPEPVPQPVQPPPGQYQQQPRGRMPYGGQPYGGTAQAPDPNDPNAQPQPQPVQPGQPYTYGGGRTARRGGQVTARATDPSEFGTLSVRVQPSDATILVDGERWNTPEGQTGFSIQMAPGRHRVEVRKEGYRGFTTDVQIEPGDLTPLNVSLLSARENMN